MKGVHGPGPYFDGPGPWTRSMEGVHGPGVHVLYFPTTDDSHLIKFIACVAADSFPFSGGAEIEQANEKRGSEGARLGRAKNLGRSREGVGRKGTACL